MRKTTIGAAAGLAALALGASAAYAHTLDEATDTLYGLGYYDVRVERASLPYSFNACKRGVRYHIHVNWYGDLVQVDELGPCGDYGYRSYNDGPYRSYRYRRDY
jgi:hypothetical protein